MDEPEEGNVEVAIGQGPDSAPCVIVQFGDVGVVGFPHPAEVRQIARALNDAADTLERMRSVLN